MFEILVEPYLGRACYGLSLGETKTDKFSFSIPTIQELWRIKNDSNLMLEGYRADI